MLSCGRNKVVKMITLITLIGEMKRKFEGMTQGTAKNDEFIGIVKNVKSRADVVYKLGNNDIAGEIKKAAQDIIDASNDFKKNKNGQQYLGIAKSQINTIFNYVANYSNQIISAINKM
jgi:hypothetical protein